MGNLSRHSLAASNQRSLKDFPDSISGWVTWEHIHTAMEKTPKNQVLWNNPIDPIFHFLAEKLQELYPDKAFIVHSNLYIDAVMINSIPFKINKVAMQIRANRAKTAVDPNWLKPFWIRLKKMSPKERFPSSYPIDSYRR